MLALVTGLGMLIAAGAVFFYDVLELSRVGVTLLTYLTPVFYPIEIYGRFLPIARLNPLFSYLEVFRSLMYRGRGSAALAVGDAAWHGLGGAGRRGLVLLPLMEETGVVAVTSPERRTSR